MIELKGKYNTCKIFTDNVDNATIGQVTALLNQESIKGSNIRIMPDCHAGAGCVIGTTMTITDKVIPNLVGVDIGCGMLTIKIKEKRLDLPKLDSIIHKEIPAGFEIRKTNHKFLSNVDIEGLYAHQHKAINLDRAEKSLGTLGGGNHFIEVDKDDDDSLYLIIHTGSRHLGKQVAEFFQESAWNRLKDGNRQQLIEAKIAELKKEGRQSEIESTIKSIKSTTQTVPHELAYCEGDLFDMYIHDMKITQKYAHWNREAIADTIIHAMHLNVVDAFHTVHNYIDTDNMILRKGSVSAQKGETLLIPINMRDGSLLCVGKGNPDWNFSAPHGAGRLKSRSQAKETITLSEFKKSMEGIFTTSVNKSTIDESPMAYKSIDEIVDNIEPTVDIMDIITPIYNFKAGADD